MKAAVRNKAAQPALARVLDATPGLSEALIERLTTPTMPGQTSPRARDGARLFCEVAAAIRDLPEVLRKGFKRGEDDSVRRNVEAAELLVLVMLNDAAGDHNLRAGLARALATYLEWNVHGLDFPIHKGPVEKNIDILLGVDDPDIPPVASGPDELDGGSMEDGALLLTSLLGQINAFGEQDCEEAFEANPAYVEDPRDYAPMAALTHGALMAYATATPAQQHGFSMSLAYLLSAVTDGASPAGDFRSWDLLALSGATNKGV